MKQSDITPGVIELSKELAEHWRMEIYRGCWIICKDTNRPYLIEVVEEWENKDISYDLSEGDGITTEPISSFKEHIDEFFIPIPSISDCLDKLRELGFKVRISEIRSDRPHVCKLYDLDGFSVATFTRNSTHEALLSALLEVVKK